MEENMLHDVNATMRFLYTEEALNAVNVTASYAQEDGSYQVSTIDGKAWADSWRHYSFGSFGNKLSHELGICSAEIPGHFSCKASELTMERKPGFVTITTENRVYKAAMSKDQREISVTAAPYKATFKPVATRYELDRDNVSALANTFGKMCKDETVYRIATSDSNKQYCDYMNTEKLFALAGVKRLAYGNAVSKYDNIKIYALNNGLCLKLGNEVICTIMEAKPKYYSHNAEGLFYKTLDPATNMKVLRPCKMRMLKGFDDQLKQYCYAVVVDGEEQVVPENLLSVEEVMDNKAQEKENEVVTNHF